jgi:hypothetical protein
MSTSTQVFEATAATFTRPNDTTAYASGDLVANSTTAGSVTPLAFTLPSRRAKVYGVKITKSAAAVTNAKFKLHIYKSSPTPANGDNGAWSTTSSGWVGSIDVDMSVNTFTDTNTASSTNSTTAPIVFTATGTVYGLLTATAAYTPAAQETISVSLLGEASD